MLPAGSLTQAIAGPKPCRERSRSLLGGSVQARTLLSVSGPATRDRIGRSARRDPMLTGEVCGSIGAVHGQVPFLHSRRRTGAYSVCARVIAC
jgi:hypothetical protein